MQASPEHLRRLPKAELHCHVEGSARPATIAELALAHGVGLPTQDIESLFAFSDLGQFLEIYQLVCRVLVDADAVRRITYESLEDAVHAGVRYREMFFSPGFLLNAGVPVSTVWDGITAGLADAHRDLDIRCRMILDVDKPSGLAAALELIAFAGMQDRDLLVGVGADSVERGVDHAAFLPAFELARRLGLRRTMHAGEDGPVDNIAVAVRTLGCERIDHGFRLLDDPALTSEVADRGIPLTSCPSSNVIIARVVDRLEDHPFDRQRSAGVAVTVNSDDPGMMRIDLADEYDAVQRAFGYDLATMEDLSLAAIDASFAPDDEKRALRRRFLVEFAALRAEYGLPPRPEA